MEVHDNLIMNYPYFSRIVYTGKLVCNDEHLEYYLCLHLVNILCSSTMFDYQACSVPVHSFSHITFMYF